MIDETNRYNIRMFFLSLVAFFICILIIMVMGVLFGMKQYSPVVNNYDRPVCTFEYKEHRI